MDKIIVSVLALLILGLCNALVAGDFDPAVFWKDGYCVQSTVRVPLPDAKNITAMVDGTWQDYALAPFPDEFWGWNTARRTEYLEIFKEMLTLGPAATREPQLSGPHNGMVATYGAARKDSAFKLNNAVKGMGFCPRADRVDALLELLEKNLDAGLDVKLDILDSLYQNARDNFTPYALVSLELYSEPGYNTQTFINQMVNPASVTVFLDVPTFKIKQIARLAHPEDPNLSDYERKVTRYVNLMHSFFHGAFPRDYIAVIYYNIEVYDSSPGRKDARGTKMTP